MFQVYCLGKTQFFIKKTKILWKFQFFAKFCPQLLMLFPTGEFWKIMKFSFGATKCALNFEKNVNLKKKKSFFISKDVYMTNIPFYDITGEIGIFNWLLSHSFLIKSQVETRNLLQFPPKKYEWVPFVSPNARQWILEEKIKIMQQIMKENTPMFGLQSRFLKRLNFDLFFMVFKFWS